MSCQIESGWSGEELAVAPDRVVRLRFWAREQKSRELLQYGEDLQYLHGGRDGMFPRVESALSGSRPGERVELLLRPEDGYGERDPERVIVQPRFTIPEEAWRPGFMIMGELPDGREAPYTVVAVDEDTITLDGNHPWAGKLLHFTFEVIEVRESTREERRCGFVLSE